MLAACLLRLVRHVDAMEAAQRRLDLLHDLLSILVGALVHDEVEVREECRHAPEPVEALRHADVAHRASGQGGAPSLSSCFPAAFLDARTPSFRFRHVVRVTNGFLRHDEMGSASLHGHDDFRCRLPSGSGSFLEHI